jgi:hypothetical protein
MKSTTPNFDTWTSDNVNWLIQRLYDLNWSYRDLDEALGYRASRGAYTYLVCERNRVPSSNYRRRLIRWWARGPQPKPPPTLLQQIQTVAVPWLRAREGQPVQRAYSRRRARVARRVNGND